MRVTGPWIENPPTQAVCRALTDAGHLALFVGGCVRNALLGAPVADIDISTDATPQRVTELCDTAGFKVVPTGIDHGTVTVVAGGIPHEITTFRRDVETDGRRAVVAFSTDVAEDARRRDFTMNALYANAEGRVIDPLGGLSDLHARRVRFIEDAGQRIREDYLRVLRFFRFHAWYGAVAEGLDAEGLAAIAANLDGLDGLSRERIGAEMKKLLAAPDPVQSIAAMRAAGVLLRVLPGAEDRALGPLVHLEAQVDAAPDWARRAACLGGQDVASRWRLSRAEERRLTLLRDAIGGDENTAALGFEYGAGLAVDIALLRAAVLETPLPLDVRQQADMGAQAVFPVAASDLMPRYKGAELGQRLKELKAMWIASGFALDRDALLMETGDGA